MDYFGILERSFAITRRYRVLWLFGFLLALFGAGSGVGNGVQYTFQGGEFPLQQFGAPPSVGVLVILIVVMLIIVLAIIAAVVNYVCQTALIGLVGEIEEGKSPTVRHGFDVGWSRSALRLFGVDVVLAVPVILVVMLVAALVAVTIALSMGNQGGSAGPAWILLICCLIFLVPVFIAAAVVLSVLARFAYRQVVLAGDGVLDGIRHGYRLIRANLGSVAVMWLIMFFVGLLWAVVNLLIGFLAFAMVGGPAALIYAIFQSGLAAVIGALPFLVAAVVIFAAINALYTVFTSAVWTLTYLELPERPVVS